MKATIWCDGSGTPTTPCACGAHVRIGETDHYFAVKLPDLGTNNEAEMWAIGFGITKAWELGARELTVYSDSQWAVYSLTGEFQSKKPKLFKMITTVRELAVDLGVEIEIHWTPRENTSIPDALAHIVLNSPFNSYTVSPVPLNMKKPKRPTKRSKFYLSALRQKQRLASSRA